MENGPHLDNSREKLPQALNLVAQVEEGVGLSKLQQGHILSFNFFPSLSNLIIIIFLIIGHSKLRKLCQKPSKNERVTKVDSTGTLRHTLLRFVSRTSWHGSGH